MSARRQLRASCAALVFTTFSFGAFAQSYPAHAITLTVPFPPGGPTDTIGRMVAEGMRNTIGQPVVVKNVAGATAASQQVRLPGPHPTATRLSLGRSRRTSLTARPIGWTTIWSKTLHQCRWLLLILRSYPCENPCLFRTLAN